QRLPLTVTRRCRCEQWDVAALYVQCSNQAGGEFHRPFDPLTKYALSVEVARTQNDANDATDRIARGTKLLSHMTQEVRGRRRPLAYEEGVQLPAQKLGRNRLLKRDADNVRRTPTSAATQEHLLTVVELGRIMAERRPTVKAGSRINPARKRAGCPQHIG